MAKQCCETCIHSRWNLTPTGRLRKDTAGTCGVPFTEDDYREAWDSVMPACISQGHLHRHAVWANRGTTCPLYELNDGAKFHCDGTRFTKE